MLRPLVPEDWQALFAVASNPAVWELHPQHDRWQEPVFRIFFEDALAKGGAIAIIDRESGCIVGSSRWERYDPSDGGSVEIGWTFLDPSCWGGAVNRELKTLMVVHALRYVHRVDFRVAEGNLRSRRAMEKIGGRLSDRSTIVATASGDVLHVVYEIDRESFASGPLAE